MDRLSVVIIAFNEEENILRCLESVKPVADEIVVVDSHSTDRTAEICMAQGARVFQHDWEGYSAQKNWANAQAAYDWVFSIDADESLSAELCEAILAQKNRGFSGAYSMPRLTHYNGQWVRHSGWYPDTKIRLWNRLQGEWRGNVHETISFNPPQKIVRLKGDLLHHVHFTDEQYRQNVDKYSAIRAQTYFQKGKRPDFYHLYLAPLLKFVEVWIFHLGFLDGKAGLKIARMGHYSMRLRYLKLQELYAAAGSGGGAAAGSEGGAAAGLKILHITTATQWRGGEQQLAYLLKALRCGADSAATSEEPHPEIQNPVDDNNESPLADEDSVADNNESSLADEESAGINIEQIVFCPRGSSIDNFCKKNSIKTYNYSKKLLPFIALELKRSVRREKISLLHSHDGHAVGIGAWAAFFGMKTPQVLHRRVIFPLKKNPFSLYKYNNSAVKRILCVSEAVQQVIQPCLRNPERAEVLYSCIDLGRFAQNKAISSEKNSDIPSASEQTSTLSHSNDSAKAPSNATPKSHTQTQNQYHTISDRPLHRQYNLPDNAFLIGNVAALTKEKDLLTFLKVAEIVTATHPQAHFVLVGEGKMRNSLQQFAKEKKLENRVTFAGFRDDIPALVSEMDIFLTTSRSEGLGTSVLDAFAAGTPVVATSVGGIVEMVEPGVSGLLADAGDAKHLADLVVCLMEDSRLREKLRKGAFEKVKQFSVKNLGKMIKDQYTKVLQEEKAENSNKKSWSETPKLSLIIAFYNNIDCLRLIYASLRQQTFRDFEVLIADDGSNAGVVEELHKTNALQPFRVTHCWHEDKGWRKNRILNEAVRRSSGDYLVFIDGDCLLEAHFLEDHYRFRKHQQMISGRRVMLNEKISRTLSEKGIEKGQLQHLFCKFPTSWKERSSLKNGLRIGNPFWRSLLVHDKYKPIKGCNFSIFKKDLLLVNGFDERYQARGTGEDDDLEARLSRLGVLPRTCRMAVVQFHYWHPHKESISLENKRLKQENDSQKVTYTPYGIVQE